MKQVVLVKHNEFDYRVPLVIVDGNYISRYFESENLLIIAELKESIGPGTRPTQEQWNDATPVLAVQIKQSTSIATLERWLALLDKRLWRTEEPVPGDTWVQVKIDSEGSSQEAKFLAGKWFTKSNMILESVSAWRPL